MLQIIANGGPLVYLTGARAELEPVWKSYYLFVATPMPGQDVERMVSHSDLLVLLDRDGNQRVNLHSDVAMSDLVSELRLLLK